MGILTKKLVSLPTKSTGAFRVAGTLPKDAYLPKPSAAEVCCDSFRFARHSICKPVAAGYDAPPHRHRHITKPSATSNRKTCVFKTHIFSCLFWFMFAVLNVTGLAAAQDPFSGNTSGSDFLPVEQAYVAELTLEENSLRIRWTIAEGYYLYRNKFQFWINEGDGPQEIKVDSQPGIKKFDPNLEQEVEIYYDSAEFEIPLPYTTKPFEIKARSQGCADAGLCYAPRQQFFQIDLANQQITESKKSLFVTAVPPKNVTPPSSQTPHQPSASGQADLTSPIASGPANAGTLVLYFFLAMCGGLILNLMPCVFPVLSLKALTFASTSGSAHAHHQHGWAYTGGVIVSFLIIACVIITARATGQIAGWGFQLQSPIFVALLTYLFFAMGLSLSGMVHFGTGLMGLGENLTAQGGVRGSFFTGVLAAIVASPCTGPLMAPALGFALTQPAPVALLIFFALGFGMAFPFLLLSYSPKLAKMLPRPGIWMEKLKELLAFPMYLTAAWLVLVFGGQVGVYGAFLLLSGTVSLAFAIWLSQNLPNHQGWRKAVQILAWLALLAAVVVVYNANQLNKEAQAWEPYSRARVAELRAEGKPIFVDFTADWCITCKWNKKVALSSDAFMAAVKKHDVVLLEADWTNENPEISATLEEFERGGIPLYLVYPKDTNKPAEVLPQFLSEAAVIEAFARAAR